MTHAKEEYEKLAEEYLKIAKQVGEDLKSIKDVIGCAIIGSAARGDIHPFSDIDLLLLIEGSNVFQWKRRIVDNIVVNIALQSQDVLGKMAKEQLDTYFHLKKAIILYDPQGTLGVLKIDLMIDNKAKKKFFGDLLDEARSYLGKAERALDEDDLESAIICMRQSAIKFAESLIFKEKGTIPNPMHMWQEVKSLSLSGEFKDLIAKVQGFESLDKPKVNGLMTRLKMIFPEPKEH